VGGDVGYGNTVRENFGGASAIRGEVDHVVRLDKFGILKSWLDDEFSALDKDILISQGGLFELAVAERYVSMAWHVPWR